MGAPGLQLFLPRQVREEREERGSPARIYPGNVPELGLVAHGTDAPVGTACRDGHRQLKAQEKQEAARFGLGFIPLEEGC